MFKLLPTGGLKWIDPKKFDLNKYTSNIPKGCVLKVDLEYPEVLLELHNDFPLIQDIKEVKEKCCLVISLRLLIFIIFLLLFLKSWCLIFFDKEKYVLHYENLQLYLRLGRKLKE